MTNTAGTLVLTEHQQEVKEELLKLLEENRVVRLIGSAGVGKTTILNEIIKNLKNRTNLNIICSAPTHKAVKVLKDKIVNGRNIIFTTTHSALKLKMQINSTTGQVFFKPEFTSKKTQPLQGAKYFIIDESSMLNEDLVKIAEEWSKKQNCKIIYVGDDKQINPVGEEMSLVFLNNYPTAYLTEIVRQQSDNPIIKLSRNLNEIYNGISFRNETGGYIYTNDKERVIKSLLNNKDPNNLKFLAYTNNCVDSVNRAVRKLLYGNPSKIELGETLIFNSLYKDYINSEEITVNTVDIKEKEFSVMVEENVVTNKHSYETVRLKYYSINSVKQEKNEFKDDYSWDIISTSEEEVDHIMVLHEDSEEDYKKFISKLISLASARVIPWSVKFEFEAIFADLKYTYALTVHKSQGSTFKQVIIDLDDISRNRNTFERDRLLYTAITRTSELLIIYKNK